MKTIFLFLILIAFFPGKPLCQQVAIEMKTTSPAGSDFSFELAANADDTPIQVDFGDGTPVDNTINIERSTITSTLGASKTVRIFGSGITQLDCYADNLTDLDISNAIDLTFLECGANGLTSIDVTNNLNLTSLFIGFNNITSINIAQNQLLTKLSVSNNFLTDLDVSNNVLLTELHCGGNLLTELDVSHNDSLTDLICNYLPITHLDVNNNLKLRGLDCSNCQLTSLDVSKNVLLQGIGCERNQIDSLDLSKNIALENLFCAENRLHTLDLSMNTQLRDIWCEINQITELKLGNMPWLWRLICQYNKIEDLDLSQCPELSEIDCNNNRLTKFDISMNDKLTWIECFENYLLYTELPLPNASWTRYKYAPQSMFVAGEVSTGDVFDLNDQYDIYGNKTQYKWKTMYYGDLEIMKDYTITEGRTVFIRHQDDSVFCEMTNRTFPQFSSTAPLSTTYLKVSGDDKPVYSFTTLNDTGSVISFSLSSGNENTPIKIDYGNGISVYDTLGINEKSYHDTLVGSQTVNIYGEGITTLNCDDNRLVSIDIVNDTTLVTLSLKNNLLRKFDRDNFMRLRSLDCSNNLIDFIGGGIYGGSMDSLFCNNNRLTFATIPINLGFWSEYVYAPQQPIQIAREIALGNEFDLSDQSNVDPYFSDPVPSRFNWKTQGGIILSEGIDYTISDGITIFKTLWEDSIYCEITNSLFPDLSGSNVLRTTFTKLVFYNFLDDLKYQEPRIYSYCKSIYIETPADANVAIFDLNGRLLINTSIHEGLNIIQMERTGLYFVKWRNRDHVFTQKIMIQ